MYNKNIVQYLFAAIITISFITMALTAILVLKDSSNIWLNITFIALLLSIFVAIISVWVDFFLKARKPGFFLISACPVNRHAAAAIPDDLLARTNCFPRASSAISRVNP